MLRSLKEFLLKRKAKKLKRKVQVHNLSTARSAIILYSYKEGKNEKLVRDFARFLKEEGIKSTTISFIEKKIKEESSKPVEELNYFYFDKNELNWLAIPQSSRIKKMIASDFDLLIDLNLEQAFPLKWIATLSKASFKVGSEVGYHKESCDLLLGTKENNIASLQEQCRHYLNIINRKN